MKTLLNHMSVSSQYHARNKPLGRRYPTIKSIKSEYSIDYTIRLLHNYVLKKNQLLRKLLDMDVLIVFAPSYTHFFFNKLMLETLR